MPDRRAQLTPEQLQAASDRWVYLLRVWFYFLESAFQAKRHLAILSARPAIQHFLMKEDSLWKFIPVPAVAIPHATTEPKAPPRSVKPSAKKERESAQCVHLKDGKSMLANYSGAWGKATKCPCCDG